MVPIWGGGGPLSLGPVGALEEPVPGVHQWPPLLVSLELLELRR